MEQLTKTSVSVIFGIFNNLGFESQFSFVMFYIFNNLGFERQCFILQSLEMMFMKTFNEMGKRNH